MTRSEFVAKFAETTGTKKSAEEAFTAFIDILKTNLAKPGDEVPLPGFGKFKVAHRAERKGKNPQTGEVITIPAKDVIVFKQSKSSVK